MKKILTLFASSWILVSPISTVACGAKEYGDWEQIITPKPVYKIEQTGFDQINFETELSDYDDPNLTIPDLKQQVENLLANHNYINVNLTILKDNKDAGTDLYRNGNYQLNYTLGQNHLLLIRSISNSMHLADVIPITSIGELHDVFPTSILSRTIFTNMSLISKISNLAHQFVAPEEQLSSVIPAQINDSTPNGYFNIFEQDGTTAWNASDEQTGRSGVIQLTTGHDSYVNNTTFYGSIRLTFQYKQLNTFTFSGLAPDLKYDLSGDTAMVITGLNNNDYFSIMMQYIVTKHVANLGYLTEIISDVIITNITNTSARLESKTNSNYFTGFADVNFRI